MRIKLFTSIFMLMIGMNMFASEQKHRNCSHHKETTLFVQKMDADDSNIFCDYTLQQWSGLSAASLRDALVTVDSWGCFGSNSFNYSSGVTEALYTDYKVQTIANHANTLAASYNGTNNGLYGLLQYLSIATTRNYENGVEITTNGWNAITQACHAVASNSAISSPTTEHSYQISGMLFATCWADNIPNQSSVLSLISNHLYRADQYDTWQNAPDDYTYYTSYYYLLETFFNFAVTHDTIPNPTFQTDPFYQTPPFYNRLNSYQYIISSLANIACDANGIGSAPFENLRTLTAKAATALRFIAAETAEDDDETLYANHLEAALLQIINCEPYLSGAWVQAAYGLIDNGTSIGYTQEQIRTDLLAQEFPNTHTFEDGNLIFHSQLSDTEILDLYEATQEVKAQFFRIFELDSDMPVAGDVNDVVQIRIYKDQNSYINYNSFLFNAPSPGGGVYIEDAAGLNDDYATIFTWDRDVSAGDSDFELEELVRHEYVHYMQGRFLVKGLWGSVNPFYDDARLTWFEEGMAEFFAGSTDVDGVIDRNVIKTRAANLDPINFADLFELSVGGEVYNLGNMLWSYWYHNKRERFRDLVSYTRQGGATAISNFDNYLSNLTTTEQTAYHNYVIASTTDGVNWTPDTESLPYDQMSTGSVSELVSAVNGNIGGISGVTGSVEFLLDAKRFHIEGNFTAVNGNTNEQDRINLYDKLDAILVEIRNDSPLNNFDFATIYYTDVTVGGAPSAKFHIVGPLGEASNTGSVIGEQGNVTISQSNSNTWKTVTLNNSYTNPVVIMGPISFAGGHQSTMNVRNVTSNSFQCQVDEWDYLDGAHATETIGYMVVEAGTHTLSNGAKLTAGNFSLPNTGWQSLGYGAVGFTTPPIVMTQNCGSNGVHTNAVTTRLRSITTSGFQVRLQEEEDNDQVHSSGRVAFVAIEAGTSNGAEKFEVNKSANNVTHAWRTLNFSQSYGSPVLLAKTQTYDGGDPIVLRYRNLGSTSTQVKCEEEKSKNTEVAHTSEVVGWVVFDTPGNITAAANSNLTVNEEIPEETTEELKVDETVGLSIHNYPNPFSGYTTIEYTLQQDVSVTLTISDLNGRQIAVLVDNEQQTVGTHTAAFDGSSYPAGMYYYTIRAGEYLGTKKMILAK